MKFLLGIICVLLVNVSYARTVARVIDIQGNAFLFSSEHKAKELKYGSKVPDLSEVMVEDGSTLSLVNTDGHIIHVNGGSLVKFFKGITELKNGYVWVNVKNSSTPGSFNTTNSIVNYNQGQFIYSFDNVSGKTQLLVLTGDVKLSNSLEAGLKVNVASGHFTLVEKNYNNGLPRAPTKIGLESYKNLKGVFVNFKNLENSKIDEMLWNKKPKTNRSIASVSDQFSQNKTVKTKRKGKLITIKTYGQNTRIPASVSPMDYYKDLKKDESLKRKPVKTGKKATIQYFGFDQKVKSNRLPLRTAKLIKIKTKQVKRLPASVPKMNLIKELKGPSEFEKSLMQKSMENKRHSDEVNNLIDDLGTYKQDFKKNY
jgi:hypothetical protein